MDAIPEHVRQLLVQSLPAWRAIGQVEREGDGSLLVTVGDKGLRISRAPRDVPFRWMIADGERTRGATSIAGLLRSFRASIDPEHRPVRLRIAPLPLLPESAQ